MRDRHPIVTMEEITDPEVIARAEAQDAKFGRNLAWFQAHGDEIFSRYRGRCICIAGQELFAADTAVGAIELARAAHPDDDGRFSYCVPKDRAVRIYAY